MPSRRYDIVLYRHQREYLTLDSLATHAGVHPALVERLVEFGLLEPVESNATVRLFDTSALSRLRMICRLRQSLKINLTGIAVIADLLDRLWAVQRENESLRSRL
jgi:chaperone modulatory protein CbpM